MNWKNYQSKISTERENQYLDYLIDTSFQGVNRLLFYHLKMKNKEKLKNEIKTRLKKLL